MTIVVDEKRIIASYVNLLDPKCGNSGILFVLFRQANFVPDDDDRIIPLINVVFPALSRPRSIGSYDTCQRVQYGALRSLFMSRLAGINSIS